MRECDCGLGEWAEDIGIGGLRSLHEIGCPNENRKGTGKMSTETTDPYEYVRKEFAAMKPVDAVATAAVSLFRAAYMAVRTGMDEEKFVGKAREVYRGFVNSGIVEGRVIPAQAEPEGEKGNGHDG